MLKTTRRSCVNCECIFTYDWDNAIDPSLIVHSNFTIENKCAVHADISDAELPQIIGYTPESEDMIVTKIVEELLQIDSLSELDATGTKQFKPGIEVQFKIEGQGKQKKIKLSFIKGSLTPQQRVGIKGEIKTKHGNKISDRVIL